MPQLLCSWSVGWLVRHKIRGGLLGPLCAHPGHPVALSGALEADTTANRLASGDGWVTARPLTVLDALKSDVEHKAGRWPNPRRMAGLDVSNDDNVSEIERAPLKMVQPDIPGLAATAGGRA